MDLAQETLKWRIRRSQKRLREQESEIRIVTARNHATVVNTAPLDLRIAARATRTEIDRLVAMAGKGTMDSCDSDSSTAGSLGRREASAPRPPMDLPPGCPPLPPDNPPRVTRLGGRTQETPGEADPLQMMPQVKKEIPKLLERQSGPRDWTATPHQAWNGTPRHASPAPAEQDPPYRLLRL